MHYINNHLRIKIAQVTFVLVGFLIAATCHADAVSPSATLANQAVKQNLSVVKSKIAEFLTIQTIGYPGKVSIHVGAIDPNMKLANCQELATFLPAGSRAWGKTSVGVRCTIPSNWTIYVQATVNVEAQYLVAATPLAQGQVLTSQDVIFEKGDLTQLPAGVFTDMAQAVGRAVSMSMTVGTVLRQEMLKVTPIVLQGQTVKLTSVGEGFSVSAEGKAMAKANEGQLLQVKVASGQIVTGIARAGGQVEVNF